MVEQKTIRSGRNCSASSLRDDLGRREVGGGHVDQAEVDAARAQQRRRDEQRVRGLRRAEDFLTLLTPALPGEADAVDRRRIDEQRLLAGHSRYVSSTLQQRRQTGNSWLSSSRLRMST